MRGPRVLITGAGGFVGIPTTQALLDRGFEVVALDNFSNSDPARLGALGQPPRLRVHQVDIRDHGAVARAVGSDPLWGVIHLAALHFIPYCVSHPGETLAVNVIGLQNLLDSLDSSPVERFLFASTAAVYRPSLRPHKETDPTEPTDVYGASKLLGEQLVRIWAIRRGQSSTTIVRLFNVVGPGDTNPHVLHDIIKFLRYGNQLRLGNLMSRRDYIYVEDVASIIVQLLVTGSEGVVNLGTGQSLSVAELVDRLRLIMARNLVVTTDPVKVRKTDRLNLQAATGRLRALLPDLSLTSLDEGLSRHLMTEGLLPDSGLLLRDRQEIGRH